MRMTILVAFVAVLCGACGEDGPAPSTPPPPPPPDPSVALVVEGSWRISDGPNCFFDAGFSGSEGGAQIGHICFPGDGTSQLSREYGRSHVVTKIGEDPPEPEPGMLRTLLRHISIPVTDSTCVPGGYTIELDAQVTGNRMVLTGSEWTRQLDRADAQYPSVSDVVLGCLETDGSFDAWRVIRQ